MHKNRKFLEIYKFNFKKFVFHSHFKVLKQSRYFWTSPRMSDIISIFSVLLIENYLIWSRLILLIDRDCILVLVRTTYISICRMGSSCCIIAPRCSSFSYIFLNDCSCFCIHWIGSRSSRTILIRGCFLLACLWSNCCICVIRDGIIISKQLIVNSSRL